MRILDIYTDKEFSVQDATFIICYTYDNNMYIRQFKNVSKTGLPLKFEKINSNASVDELVKLANAEYYRATQQIRPEIVTMIENQLKNFAVDIRDSI